MYVRRRDGSYRPRPSALEGRNERARAEAEACRRMERVRAEVERFGQTMERRAEALDRTTRIVEATADGLFVSRAKNSLHLKAAAPDLSPAGDSASHAMPSRKDALRMQLMALNVCGIHVKKAKAASNRTPEAGKRLMYEFTDKLFEVVKMMKGQGAGIAVLADTHVGDAEAAEMERLLKDPDLDAFQYCE